MGFFDVVGRINPIKGAIFGTGGKSHRPGKKWIEKQENRARQEELDAAMKDYNEIPQQLMKNYTLTAQQAGTYGNTPEFAAGLQSEVDAGSRGARYEALARINSLRKAMGQDEFNPEGAGQTLANETQASLRRNPDVAEEGATPEGIVDPAGTGREGSSSGDSATGVQNAPVAPTNTRTVRPRAVSGSGIKSRLSALSRYSVR